MEVFPHWFYTRSICRSIVSGEHMFFSGNKGHYICVGCPRMLYPMSNSEVRRCENSCTADIHTDSNSTTVQRLLCQQSERDLGSRIWGRRRICICTASNSWPLPRFQRSPANVGFVARNSVTAIVVAWEKRSLREPRAPPLPKKLPTQ